jgi:hypothetical protein
MSAALLAYRNTSLLFMSLADSIHCVGVAVMGVVVVCSPLLLFLVAPTHIKIASFALHRINSFGFSRLLRSEHISGLVIMTRISLIELLLSREALAVLCELVVFTPNLVSSLDPEATLLPQMHKGFLSSRHVSFAQNLVD